eukprot:4420541-Pyramimonas_sp.AAC.1
MGSGATAAMCRDVFLRVRRIPRLGAQWGGAGLQGPRGQPPAISPPTSTPLPALPSPPRLARALELARDS